MRVASQGSAKKRLLVIVRRPPYGDSLARSGIDTALAAAAFDMPVSLLFAGDGVLQLMPDQDSGAIGRRNLGRLLASLPLYEIDSVYADSEAAERYGLDTRQAPLPVQPLDSPEREENTRLARAYCDAHPRWQLSIQTHKLLGIP